MANIHLLNRLGARTAPMINWFGRQPWARWLMELLTGIDRRRSLPPLHADHFRGWFASHVPDANAGKVGRVILMDDCFTTFNEPEIGQAAVRVLERAGYAIELAGLTCCGRAMISKGFLSDARDLARAQIPALPAR